MMAKRIYHEITHVTEEITPEVAERYLERNSRNRVIREGRVRQLEAMMRDGQWAENGEAGVTFDWNDILAGGQHTLAAVVRSGTAIRCRVTRGVDPAARVTMNDSRKQMLADDLHAAGVMSSNHVEALLRKILAWRQAERENEGRGGLAAWNRTGSAGRAALAAEWPAYSEEIIATLGAVRRWEGGWGLIAGNRGALAFMYWLITEHYGYPQAAAEAFFDILTWGSQDPEDRTVLMVRTKFAVSRQAPHQVWWMSRIWNAWQKGEQLKHLQIPKNGMGNPYPVLRKPR